MDIRKDDTFLSRWLQNELSEDERKEFEASEDFAHYNRIIQTSDRIKSPEFNEEGLLSNIKANRGAKVVAIPRRSIIQYGIAAAVALLVGVFTLFNFLPGKQEKFTSGIGEQKTLTLPDGSEVIINAQSTLAYYPKRWVKKRTLALEGEGFFDVRKGSAFTVKTENGTVTVLGTQFNVRSIGDYFEVACNEGKVQVVSGDQTFIITPGMTFKTGKNMKPHVLETSPAPPTWLEGKSSFVSVPVSVVLESLTNQYDIEFTGNIPNGDQLFTGSYPDNNLNVALQVVFSTLEIRYQITGDRTVELLY